MFYETGEDGLGHRAAGLKHSPMNAIVSPRPIGWISTLGKDGVPNLSPFSYFNAVSAHPPMVMFAANGSHAEGGSKDSLQNVRDTGEFVVNICSEELAAQMNDSSTAAPRSIDEFNVAGLTKAPSRIVKAPRVAEAPAHLECRLIKIVELPPSSTGEQNNTVIGRVVAVHVRDEFITDGRVDTVKMRPVGRLGYFDYVVISHSFEILRPGWPLKKAGQS